MAAVLLTVNLDSSWDGTYAADVASLQRSGVLRKSWAVVDLPVVDAGADVWLLSVRSDGARAGLIGHGVLAGSASEHLMYGDPSRPRGTGDAPSPHLLIDFDLLLNRGDETSADAVLRDPAHGRTDEWFRRGSVHVLSRHVSLALRTLWARQIAAESGATAPGPGVLPASALRRRMDNRFESDPELRRTMLAHRGSICHACGLDGEQSYGSAGIDVMQVHLITPPALIDEAFVPDALTDLVPLCPTCHVVVHGAGSEPLSVGEVRSMLRSHGFLRGSVLSEHQLEAEEAAVRILEAGG